MSCAVPGCSNDKKNSKKTLFSLPKDRQIAKQWITPFNRKNELPKYPYVYEDHFSSDSFDQNNEMITYRHRKLDN